VSRQGKPPLRFTPGDYYRPPSGEDRRYYFGSVPRFAWSMVLSAMERVAPDVARSLAREVYPAYQNAAAHLAGVPPLDPRALEAMMRLPCCPAQVHALQRALTSWAERWHLNEPGLLVRALETLLCWQHRPGPRRRREWCLQGPASPLAFPHAADVLFVVKGWHAQTEPRQVAEQRILDDLRRQTCEYLDRAEDAARQYGLVKAPTKIEENHFAWFVRFQVLGESLSDIAKQADTGPSTVKRAIDSIGHLLSGPHWDRWKRPPGKSGPRPRRP
jgi:hypothetical protein